MRVEKTPPTPDQSQESPDCMSVYASDHSPETPSISSVLSDQPDRLWAVGELARRYQCSDRTIQKMMKFVKEAYPTAPLKDRQGKRSMYTSLCVQYLDSLDQSKRQGIDSPQWVQSQQEQVLQSPSPSDPQEHSPSNSPSPVVAGGQLAVVGAGTMDVHTVPSSKIEVLQGFVESKKPQPLTPIDLNGTAEAGADRAIALMEHLQQRRERTDAVIGQLYEREQSVSTTEQALDVLEAELAEQKALEQAAIQKAYELRERETGAQERLGKLEARSQQ